MMNARLVYEVRGMRADGSVTCQCPTADWALKKLRDFLAKGYSDITVRDPDGRQVSEADVINTVEGSGAAPAEDALPAVPQISRQPALT
ncbi:hypothetical protein [Methylobacterium radiotolerans]|jgi:hypothetical protein|uniref:hypothetical protein n=2 Tax=Methylobacteriaceae TaxID=119045 RepID=UPI0005DAAEAC|nr:hypothetical protein [Methylobacterium radiotolerans]GAN51990.1 hypothetical protein ME121_6093 [Methylobacterium sp. ME121]